MSRLIIILTLLLMIAQSVYAQIGISPQTFDVSLSEAQKSHSFRLFNLGKEPVEIQVSVANWLMNETNQLTVVDSTLQSLDQWMIINPLHFTIPAGQSQAIRFAIRPAIELDPGEHRAVVYFDEVLEPDPSPDRANLRSRFRIGAAVYGQVGDVTRVGEFLGARFDQNNAYIKIVNTGSANVRMKGQWSLWRQDQYPGIDAVSDIQKNQEEESLLPGMLAMGVLPTTPVLPGDTREILIPLNELDPLSIGDQVILVIRGKLGEVNLHEAIPTSIPEPTDAQ